MLLKHPCFEVLNQAKKLKTDGELKPINLSNVDDGVYFITLTNRDIKLVKRFIIQ